MAPTGVRDIGWQSFDGFTMDDLLDEDILMDYEPSWSRTRPTTPQGAPPPCLLSCFSSPGAEAKLTLADLLAAKESPLACSKPALPLPAAVADVKAARALADFCQRRPSEPGCVVPTRAELESLWLEVASVGAVAVASALRRQLSPPSGGALGGFWAPRLRALHALEYFGCQGGAGAEAFEIVEAKAGPQLRRLAENVPQCSKQAKRILTMKQVGCFGSGKISL